MEASSVCRMVEEMAVHWDVGKERLRVAPMDEGKVHSMALEWEEEQ